MKPLTHYRILEKKLGKNTDSAEKFALPSFFFLLLFFDQINAVFILEKKYLKFELYTNYFSCPANIHTSVNTLFFIYSLVLSND